MSSMQMGTQMVKLRGGSKGLVRFFFLDEHKSCIRWRPSRKNEKAKSECLLRGNGITDGSLLPFDPNVFTVQTHGKAIRDGQRAWSALPGNPKSIAVTPHQERSPWLFGGLILMRAITFVM